LYSVLSDYTSFYWCLSLAQAAGADLGILEESHIPPPDDDLSDNMQRLLVGRQRCRVLMGELGVTSLAAYKVNIGDSIYFGSGGRSNFPVQRAFTS